MAIAVSDVNKATSHKAWITKAKVKATQFCSRKGQGQGQGLDPQGQGQSHSVMFKVRPGQGQGLDSQGQGQGHTTARLNQLATLSTQPM